MDATLIKVLGHAEQIEKIIEGWRTGAILVREDQDILAEVSWIKDEIESLFIKAGVPLPYDDEGGE